MSKSITSSPVPCICTWWLLFITQFSSLKSFLQSLSDSRASLAPTMTIVYPIWGSTCQHLFIHYLFPPAGLQVPWELGSLLSTAVPRAQDNVWHRLGAQKNTFPSFSPSSAPWEPLEGIHFGVNILEPWKCWVFSGIGYIRNLTALGTKNVQGNKTPQWKK